MESIRVLVVDDHPVVRQGVRSLLSSYPDFDLVGEADSGQGALDGVGRLDPDVILLDIRMPGESGLDVLRQLRQAAPRARVLMLTSFDDDEYVARALQGGAHGYVLKSASDEMLASAVRAAFHGEHVLSPAVMSRVVQQFAGTRRERTQPESAPGVISADEQRILKLLAAGSSNANIAAELFLSETTVKRKLQDIFEKLGVASRAQAAAEAVRRGLV